jgi:hypothetical protein
MFEENSQEQGQEQEQEEKQEQGTVVGIPEGYSAENKTAGQENQKEDEANNEANQDGENQENKTSEQSSKEEDKKDDGQWYLREGILGTGDRPAWLLEKYGFNMENQAKAYSEAGKKIGELNQRLGAFSGSPDSYDFSSIEDDNFQFDKQDKFYNEFVTKCQNANVSQEFALEVATIAKQMQLSPKVNVHEEKKEYGHTFDSDTKHIANWINNNVEDKEDVSALKQSICTARSLRALKTLMNKNGFQIPGNEVPYTPRETLKDLKQEFAQNLYDGENLAKNPEKAKKWMEKFNKHSK